MNRLKNFTLIISLTFMTFILSAQNYSELKEIKLSDSLSCIVAQSKVLECCDYLLTNPCVENLKSLNAVPFVIDWMGATSNFNFSLEDNFYKIIKQDIYLASRYYAALAKTAIENRYTVNCIELQLKAITICLEYCENPLNKVNITSKIQKYIDAKNSKKLKELIVLK